MEVKMTKETIICVDVLTYIDLLCTAAHIMYRYSHDIIFLKSAHLYCVHVYSVYCALICTILCLFTLFTLLIDSFDYVACKDCALAGPEEAILKWYG